jgi:very-short-patch-repair endonuclease
LSIAEDELEMQLKAASVPFVREVRIKPPRRYRADFVIDGDLVIEVEGGIWNRGRHTRGIGVTTDCEKSAIIAALCMRLIRVTPQQIKSGQALEWILEARHGPREG